MTRRDTVYVTIHSFPDERGRQRFTAEWWDDDGWHTQPFNAKLDRALARLAEKHRRMEITNGATQ